MDKQQTLINIGIKKYGLEMIGFFKCQYCGVEYPVIDSQIKCNGYAITECPWCRLDSQPYQNGRGI